MYRRLYSIIFFFTLWCGIAIGAPLTPQQAQIRLQNSAQGRRMGAQPLTLIYTEAGNETPVFYVFSKAGKSDNGFVIVSADDLAIPVLGYSDDGEFCYDSMPEQMKWWLGEYAAQIEWARKQKPRPTGSKTALNRPQREPIESMVHARWDQDAPFNDLCPTYSTGKTVVGCVATAMSQLLRYWQYPSKGKSTHTYTYNNVTHTFDYGNTEFLWNKMPYIYTSSWSNDNKLAVATLCYSCGVAVDMQYNVSSVGGSGAYSADVTPALIEYFDYAPSTQHRYREMYTIYDWEEMVYNSLADGCPVYYHGQGSYGGHAFVVDGYEGEGYFHLNWGWSGSSNGYFLLTALDPPTLGIGGGGGGFNFSQGAILHLKPNFEGSQNIPYLASNDFTFALSSKTIKYTGGAYNYSNETLSSIQFGLTLTNDAGQQWHAMNSTNHNLPVHYGLRTYSATLPSNLPDGEYYVNPSFSYLDSKTGTRKYAEMGMPPYLHNHYLLIVENGEAELYVFSTTEIEVPEFKVTTPVHQGTNFGISANLKNDSGNEIFKQIFIGWYNSSGTFIGVDEAILVSIPAGETLDFEKVLSVPSRVSYINGNTNRSTILSTGVAYQLGIVANNGTSSAPTYELISNLVPITLQSTPSNVTLRASNLEVRNSSSVYASDIHMGVDLKSTSGFYTEPIYAFILEGNNQMIYHVTPVQFIQEGETKHLDFQFPFDAGEQNHTYSLLLNYRKNGSNAYLAQTNFTVGTTGVETISMAEDEFRLFNLSNSVVATAPNKVETAQLYTLHGVAQAAEMEINDNTVTLNLNNLAKGVYLLRVVTPNATHTFRILRQ